MKEKKMKIVLFVLIGLVILTFVFFVTKNKASAPEKLVVNTNSDYFQEKDKEVKNSNPKPLSDYIVLIEKSMNDKNYTKAKDDIEKGLILYPASPVLLKDYVLILSIMHENKKAIVYSDKLIATDPANYYYWKLKIQIVRSNVIEYSAEQKSEVQKLYDDALLATNNNIEIISAYAVFAEDFLSKQKAIELWKLAQKINPIGSGSYQIIIDRLSK